MKSTKVKEAQAAGKFTVLFDSSVRTGPDILQGAGVGSPSRPA
jgi:lactate 2-monooxygenase